MPESRATELSSVSSSSTTTSGPAPSKGGSLLVNVLKLVAAAGFFYAALVKEHKIQAKDGKYNHASRILQERGTSSSTVPVYMKPLMEDLRQRQKLFDETPPEEIKYWFEYTGPLQVRTGNETQGVPLCGCFFICFDKTRIIFA